MNTNGGPPEDKEGTEQEPVAAKEQEEQPHYGRGQNPNTKAALAPHRFTKGKSGNPNGRPLGKPDRSTVIQAWMGVKIYVEDPTAKPEPKEYDEEGKLIKREIKLKRITLYDAAALGMFKAAAKGNVMAMQEIQDTLHGKIPAKVEAKHTHDFATLAKMAAEEISMQQWEEGKETVEEEDLT
jgi:hypothetical protein